MDRSAGKVTFCGIMLVLALGIGIHLGYLYGKMYYGYLKMEEAMKEASLSVVTEKDETIRRDKARRGHLERDAQSFRGLSSKTRFPDFKPSGQVTDAGTLDNGEENEVKETHIL